MTEQNVTFVHVHAFRAHVFFPLSIDLSWSNANMWGVVASIYLFTSEIRKQCNTIASEGC